MLESGLKGTYAHKLDGKGRIVLPASFRQGMGQHVVATIDPDYYTLSMRGLTIYPIAVWEAHMELLKEKSQASAAARHKRRLSMSYAHDLEVDTAGRILIPQMLRNEANIGLEVNVIGNIDSLEIWDPAVWEEYRKYVFSLPSEE